MYRILYSHTLPEESTSRTFSNQKMIGGTLMEQLIWIAGLFNQT